MNYSEQEKTLMYLDEKISEQSYSDLPPELFSLCGCKDEFTVLCDAQHLVSIRVFTCSHN